MKQKSRYVFGAALAGAAFGGVPQMIQKAHAAPITAAGFSFESSYTAVSGTNSTGGTVASSTGASIGPLLAESGAGSAYGVHAAATTVYSVPAGNGSAHSLSSTAWAVGDYYQFSVPTGLIDNVVVSFDQISSSTGPSQFTLQYTTDGSHYSAFSGYTMSYNTYTFSTTNSTTTSTTGTGSSGFSSGASNTALNYAFDLSGITGLNEDALAGFRIVDASTVSLSGGTVAATGTDRVDNFVVSGTAAAGVPEPTTLSLVAVGAAGLLARRRESKV